MRQHVQRSIREVHRTFFRRALPSKLSINIEYYTGNQRQLDELLCFLGERGYAFTGPGEFLTAVGNTCFLSFDDNYRSWLRTLPIFERYQVHATFYVNSWPFRDRVSETDMRHYIKNCGLTNVVSEQETTLSTVELREIAAAGHTIGAHTHTHPVLTALPQDTAREEIRICKEELAVPLRSPPGALCLPLWHAPPLQPVVAHLLPVHRLYDHSQCHSMHAVRPKPTGQPAPVGLVPGAAAGIQSGQCVHRWSPILFPDRPQRRWREFPVTAASFETSIGIGGTAIEPRSSTLADLHNLAQRAGLIAERLMA